jgi:hypothetical protein
LNSGTTIDNPGKDRNLGRDAARTLVLAGLAAILVNLLLLVSLLASSDLYRTGAALSRLPAYGE